MVEQKRAPGGHLTPCQGDVQPRDPPIFTWYVLEKKIVAVVHLALSQALSNTFFYLLFSFDERKQTNHAAAEESRLLPPQRRTFAVADVPQLQRNERKKETSESRDPTRQLQEAHQRDDS
jgi:hypothetical protein